ncbi:MAG: hemerythrin domain-containing protein [Rubrimonas sp.]|uniref:hemerythrin domain-containing protein n=1 Tax=Rubrimonas sp. TaxID=2036015 RepID=UPI002FDE9D2E
MRADPFGYFDYDNRAQRALADMLEGIADSLPDEINRASAALAAGLLRSAIAHHDAIEEQALFPLIEARAPLGASLRRAVAIARREHGETIGRAIELAEELDALARTGRARNAESLGFMLRAFFDGLRRHMDWAEATIHQQARDLLTREDLVTLGIRLAAIAAREGVRERGGFAVIEGGAMEAHGAA